MAPELRKRKSVSEAQKSNGVTKTAEKPTLKGKRKAVEDASPASIKKQKPARAAVAASKPTATPTKETKSKKAAKKEVVEEAEEENDEGGMLRIDDSDDSDGEDNEGVKKLAAEVDSDEEALVDKASSFKPGQDVGKIPSVSKDLVKTAKKRTGEPGVIYIGRIPHGFYEHEMRQYLSQFGPVTRVRLSRNKKTGASKHFAFVEFEESSTAEVVAKTMDNYLLFGHILKCKTIPKENVHEDLFKGANRRFKAVPRNKMAGFKLQKPLSESAWKTKVSKEKNKRAEQAAKFKDMGYEFEAPDLKDVPPPQPAQNSAEEPEAIEAAPVAEESTEAETKPSKESKTKEIEAETVSIPALAKAKAGKATKRKGKKVKA
ncbi:nucleolar protein [Conoideocrella luteorostrata]|uniref:Nucleolar protein n=1 Tax=Conoideocrella luteorostrata TaxID=1105319 RepID=A0AAJ0CG43_9HYPO|nr:nucleolar protein [Conoideocrella luteorostrata]